MCTISVTVNLSKCDQPFFSFFSLIIISSFFCPEGSVGSFPDCKVVLPYWWSFFPSFYLSICVKDYAFKGACTQFL